LTLPEVLVDRVVAEPQTTPRPPMSWKDGGDAGSAALCVAKGLSRRGDGLVQLIHCVVFGVSWKPIAAALRCSDFNRLAFILASYSSIDLTTYS
jgi:hypothetical protein